MNGICTCAVYLSVLVCVLVYYEEVQSNQIYFPPPPPFLLSLFHDHIHICHCHCRHRGHRRAASFLPTHSSASGSWAPPAVAPSRSTRTVHLARSTHSRHSTVPTRTTGTHGGQASSRRFLRVYTPCAWRPTLPETAIHSSGVGRGPRSRRSRLPPYVRRGRCRRGR